ncbi:MAG: TM2 domain-containing protein [Candidatus Lokiarchaeota archaeon]|nr:TM2 domain-containing protein [Candidatus Lokiarchaeota archaeon]
MAQTISNTLKGCTQCGTLISTASKFCAYCGIEQHAPGNGVNIEDSKALKVICPSCGEAVDRDDARFCPVCGHELFQERVVPADVAASPLPAPAPVAPVAPPKVAVVAVPATNPAVQAPATPLPPGYVMNSKGKRVHRVTAGVLGIVLGSVGAHWFYIGRPELGVLSILTSWTGIPAIVGFIHGIIYLTSKDEHFKAKYLP